MNVSVVIPTYNRENTILRAIESVLKQSYPIHEIIVIDDNSSDATSEVIEKLNNPKVKYIKNDKNKGAAFCRNQGIEKASGDLIAFQDSDDEWLENKLEIQVGEMEKSNAAVVGCAYNQFLDNKIRKIPVKDIESSINIYEKLLWENFISTPTMLIKSEIAKIEIFDAELPRFQDWELMLRLAKRYKVIFINQILVNSYIQENSISINVSDIEKAVKIIMEKHYDDIENNPNLLSNYYQLVADFTNNDREKQIELYEKAHILTPKNYKLKVKYYLTKYKMFKLLEILLIANAQLKGSNRKFFGK